MYKSEAGHCHAPRLSWHRALSRCTFRTCAAAPAVIHHRFLAPGAQHTVRSNRYHHSSSTVRGYRAQPRRRFTAAAAMSLPSHGDGITGQLSTELGYAPGSPERRWRMETDSRFTDARAGCSNAIVVCEPWNATRAGPGTRRMAHLPSSSPSISIEIPSPRQRGVAQRRDLRPSVGRVPQHHGRRTRAPTSLRNLHHIDIRRA